MPIGTRRYILRFGEDRTKDMSASFRDDETLRENLIRIIPKGIEQGFIPKSYSADHVEVDCKERTLVLDQPIKGQNIPENALLVLRDVLSLIKIRMRLKPDNGPAVIESVVVKPDQVLKNELSEFAEKVYGNYKFYGRRVKRFDLLLDKKKLDLNMTLRSQNVKSDIETTFKPRVRFEWPPRLVWPPGPFTTYLIGLIVVVAVIAAVRFHRSTYYVTLSASNPECIFYSLKDGETVRIGESGKTVRVGARDTLRVYPNLYPIFDYPLHLRRWSLSHRKTINMDKVIDRRFRATPAVLKVTVQLMDAQEHPVDQEFPALINGFEHGRDSQKRVEIELHYGKENREYEIRFKCDSEDLEVQYTSPNIEHLGDFLFRIKGSSDGSRGVVNLEYLK